MDMNIFEKHEDALAAAKYLAIKCKLKNTHFTPGGLYSRYGNEKQFFGIVTTFLNKSYEDWKLNNEAK
jgi:hypothetical protein